MSRNTAKLTAGRDTWVNQAKPNANYRGSTALRVRANTTDRGRFSYIYFPSKIPKNATVVNATLRLTMGEDTTGTRTVSVRRISEGWKQGKTTWNNKPSVVGDAVSITRAGRSSGDKWEFDVTPHMQLVANGAKFYGWRIEIDEDTARDFRSSEARYGKPVLELEWNEAPYPPTDLNPGGAGYVSSTSPTLSWDFRDNRGTTAMGGFRLQVASDALFSNIVHDSGNVTATIPVYDLSTAAGWTALSTSDFVYWRVKVKDTANNWSDWSDVASFAYDAKGTLTITGPSGNTVSDPSPTIAWTLTGKAQSQWQVVVRDTETGAELYDSGRYASLDQSWTIPAKVRNKSIIGKKNHEYTIVVRVWDDVDRAGTDIVYEQTKVVTYAPGTGTAPSTPTATTPNDEPGITLTWTRAEAPDRYDIWRSNVVNGTADSAVRIDSVEPGEVVTSTAGTWQYTDYTARHKHTYRYTIGASVNGVAVESSPVTATRTQKVPGIWLVDQLRDIKVCLIGDDAGSWSMGEESTVYMPVGASSARLVTQSLRGYEGSISGILAGNENKSIYQQEEEMFELKATPGQTYMLVLPDFAIPVVINNVTVEPTPHKETVRNVSFDFYQQGSLVFRDTL